MTNMSTTDDDTSTPTRAVAVLKAIGNRTIADLDLAKFARAAYADGQETALLGLLDVITHERLVEAVQVTAPLSDEQREGLRPISSLFRALIGGALESVRKSWLDEQA